MISRILVDTLYLLALINPISKICVLTVFSTEVERREMRRVAVNSTLVAFAILAALMVAGDFALHNVFHVELYSLRVVGGIVLFMVGLKGLQRGVFFEVDAQQKFADLSIVPLACPMIAGPATIAATLSLTAEKGVLLSAPPAALALALNLAFMLLARRIGAVLVRYNVMGALIRITGLIVATVGAQMVLSGLGEWLKAVR